ncbi:TonB-dependent receptor plug domain-containing protein [Adhaeribacter radiodurans]|uniref:TonB-dependent receptor plug domain-containing protein n=1 Tax=Adhaeribacter radiodurans TaxID=2745197 RepID=A0A7L7LA76_9BACT|nr:TonB-dependent receptor plug domain-containing protein [Adhaeribacter radiodurans]QMU29653.1 TonB-dependent receptor plug domain-containing protein [Adhaeribacter radiodurans]
MNNRKLRNVKYFLPALLLVMLGFVSPPADWVQKLKSNLDTFRTQYAAEKVYVTLDKPYYAPGQTIWLKGFVLDAASLHPSAKSNVLYVDLLNADNKPVEQLTLKAERGKTAGDIQLSTGLPAGNYRLVAYTQWMRNFGEENFFNKEIQILGANNSTTNATGVAKKLEVQFFPEGGDLVEGLSSRVAFKAIGANGTGVAIAGSVYDDRGQKVVDFADAHLGMGAVEIQPLAGQKYVAKITAKDGKTTEYALPAAKPTGYTMRVDETTEGIYWQVSVAGKITQPESLVITGISRDALQYSEAIKIQPGKTFRFTVAKAKFPTGIVRFNLARANGEPIAERLLFADNQDDLNVTLTADKKGYNGRDKVTMQLVAQDKKGKPVATDFALAVTDAELVKQAKNGLNLKAHLLLTSDLRGYVEQPGYYFEQSNLNRKQALDYLLLTQGWRRFNWQETATGKFPVIKYPNETDLFVSGKLVTNKNKPVEGGEALLYLQGQHQAFITTETDKQGAFAFNGFDFTGTIDVVVQGTDADGRRERLRVKMDEYNFIPQAPAFSAPSWTDGLLASTSKDFLLASNQQLATINQDLNNYTLRGILLSAVEVKGEKDMVQPFKLHDKADVVINRNELTIAPSGNIIESLQGRVAGLQVYRTGQNQFRARIRGQMSAPLYLLDGMPISESTLSSISQFDVSRVEILKSAANSAIYGGRASGGVIALFTDRNNEEQGEVKPGTYIIIHHAKGYSKVREFYSPTYDGATPASNEPDLRTTLYWNPSVKTDAQGKATVTFYTADRTTTYQVLAEGISDNGQPGSGVTTFGVNSKKGNS